MSQLFKLLSIAALVAVPTAFILHESGGVGNCRTGLSLEHLAIIDALTPETITRLKSERSVSQSDICVMPLASLQKSLFRLEQPKPDHPGEAQKFRQLQQLSDNQQLNTKNWQASQNFVKQTKSRQVSFAGLNSTSWESIGPGNIGGRIRSIAFDPDDSNRIYAGSVSGGVWLTENAGSSWQATDDFMANLSVSSIIFDSTNSNVIYAGTGEGMFNSDNVRGMGIFKSIDKGQNWQALANTQNSSDFYWVNRLTMLDDSSRILAATHTGIWTSEDSGITWTKTHSGRTNDIDVHPDDNNKLVAGKFGSVIYSTDAGLNWNTASGLGSIGNGRVEVAYARSNPDVVYASVNSNSGEIWKSVDGGVSFSLVNTGNTYLGSQGWYDNALWVDPVNADHVIVGGLDLWRSTNGGSTLNQISKWWQAPSSAHADHHFVIEHPEYDAVNNKQVYFANDGGVYTAANIELANGNIGWQELNNQLAITQFYGVGIAANGTVIGGTQDNGTLVYTGDSENWGATFGGDGGFSAADPVDSNYLYGEYVFLQIHRSSNGGNFSNYIYADAMTNDGPNFIAPFILDPNDANRMLAGAEQLWVSNNVKAGTPAWSSVKGVAVSNSPISAIAVAAGDANVIYVGHNDGSLFKTINGLSATPIWTDIASVTMPQRFMMRIAIDPDNHDNVFVSYGGYENNNLWKSTNAGVDFSESVGSTPNILPSAPIRTIAIHPIKTQQIYVGTAVGIFVSGDGGETWDFNNNGPANVSVDELVWSGEDTLYAATHGRGIFRADVNGDIPNGITFNELLDVEQNQILISNEATISGISVEVDMSIVNGEYSIGCTDTFTAAAGKANNGDTVCIRHSSANDYYTATTSDISIGASSFAFVSRTVADILPDSVAFDTLTEVALDSAQTSNQVIVSGITNQVEVSVTGGQYSIGCVANNFTSQSSVINLNDSVCVKQTASPQHFVSTVATLTLGSLNVDFTVTTLPDTTPNQFSFNNVSDIELSSLQTSSSVTVAGFQVAIPIGVTNGEYSIGCLTEGYTSASGEISPDDQVCVRHAASASYVTDTTTTLDVNGVTADFVSTTSPDRMPDTINFTAQTNVELSAQLTSNAVVISGLGVPVDISVNNGEYSIGCTATFIAAPSTINNAESVCVRHTSSAANGSSVQTSLTVGSVISEFNSTTKAAKKSGGGSVGFLSLLLIGVIQLMRRR